jgi:hypothetical protein
MASAAVITAAMGFGTVQVPVRPDTACDGAGPCNDSLCARVCRAAGFPGGFCNSGGGCSCYL